MYSPREHSGHFVRLLARRNILFLTCVCMLTQVRISDRRAYRDVSDVRTNEARALFGERTVHAVDFTGTEAAVTIDRCWRGGEGFKLGSGDRRFRMSSPERSAGPRTGTRKRSCSQ